MKKKPYQQRLREFYVFTFSTFGHTLKYVRVNTAWDHQLSLQTEYYLAPYENPTRDIVRK